MFEYLLTKFCCYYECYTNCRYQFVLIVVRGWCSWRFRRRWSRQCWHGRLTGSSSLLLLLSSRGCEDSVWAPTEWLTACRNWRRRFLVNFSRNSQHFRIPTQPVILVVNGQFSDFYVAVIIRQGLSNPYVQPLFDLVLKLHGLEMSGLAMSTLATWSHVVQSRDVRSRDFSVLVV